MVIDPALTAVVGALWLALQGMAGLVYRELRQQIADKDARISRLEAEAAAALIAKDAELNEWKRIVFALREIPPK